MCGINNHYAWLEANLPIFLMNIGLHQYVQYCSSMIIADGDKCDCYKVQWGKEGIPFFHGVALYLITKIPPYDKEVRETVNGCVAPNQLVSKNYNKFKKDLPNIK